MSLDEIEYARFENNCFIRGENCKPFCFACNLSAFISQLHIYTFGHCVILSGKKITEHCRRRATAVLRQLNLNDLEKAKVV